ncbi:MAG TPA: PAS domain-containing protein [Dongiaceae bacterium]|nr:PAS domain-containing protein [Dongiaceae bacterium]
MQKPHRLHDMNDAGRSKVEPRHPDLLRLLDYWHGKRGARAFPRRADVDPVDLGFMLARIALTEVHDDPRRYRLRLVGSWWAQLSGAELTGTWLDEWPKANLGKLTIDTYEAVIATRTPLCAQRDAWVDEKKLSYEILLLPLSEDDQRISMILTGIGPS